MMNSLLMRTLRMRWLFNKRVGFTLLWIGGLLVVASLVNVIGIRVAGDIQNWSLWLKENASLFLVWRLCLYGAVGYGWWWMRQRVITREVQEIPKAAAQSRFIRIEACTMCILLVLEVSLFLN